MKKNNTYYLVRYVIAQVSSEESKVVVIPVEEGGVLPHLAAGHADHLLGFLRLAGPWLRGLGGSLTRRKLLGLDNLRGSHQLHHLLGLQFYLVRSNLKVVTISGMYTEEVESIFRTRSFI